jgi:hypothetical protein
MGSPLEGRPAPERIVCDARSLRIDGRGTAAETVKTGGSYPVPPGASHDARSGPHGAKVIATYVVEESKPLASPAP